MKNEELISVAEAADFLKISEQQVRVIIRNKELHAERVGKQWILKREEIENFVSKKHFIIEPDDQKRQIEEIPEIVAMSFFSGAMGMDIGMQRGGIHSVLACEIDKHCRKTIIANNPGIGLIGDICKYNPDEILEYAGIPKGHKIDVIFGGPPCQAFSTAGKRRSFEDERGNYFLSFIDLIGSLKPTYAVIENVRGLLSAPYPLGETIGEPIKGGALYYILKKLKTYGYTVSFNLYNSANFGAAQIRERVVLICKLGKSRVNYLEPTHSEDASGGLKPWETLSKAIEGLDPESQNYISFPEKRLKYFRHLIGGQNWRDLPKEIQIEAMGKSYYLGGGKTGFYRRLALDRPSPTLVTHPAMPATDLCHPIEDRPLSVEEYARIQGFPDDWLFCGKTLDIYKQIGNAVPVPLGEAIAKAILADMKGEKVSQGNNVKFSRYLNTDEVSWKKNFEKELKNFQEAKLSGQLKIV